MIPNFWNEKSHGSRELPWHTFTMLLIAISLFVLGGPANKELVFNRDAIMQGELWRLLTGHWVHSDTEHMLLNLAAFAFLGCMIEMSLGRYKLYSALIVGMCLVNTWLWIFIPTLDFYCGLSGILNTLLFVILIDGWLRTRKFIFLFIAVAATAKVVFELIQSSAIFSHTTWPAIPEAHLAGTLAAVILIFCKEILSTRTYILKIQMKLRKITSNTKMLKSNSTQTPYKMSE